ncbi:hypothetical protein Tco_1068918, partial [Tanacetum coccineum]
SPLSAKPKKGKPQTVTPRLPKSQCLELTEGSEQSHSVSSGIVPDPQDLERNIQLASTGFPYTLDEGTRKSQPLPKGNATHPKDSGGNIQPFDMGLTSMTSDEGSAKTTPRPEGSLGDKDSGGNIPPIDMEPIHTSVTDTLGTFAKYQSDEEEVLAAGEDMDEDIQVAEEVRTPSPKQDQPKPSNASIEECYDENVAHIDQTDKLVETTMSAIDKSSMTIKDLYKGLNLITQLLKDIINAVKDDPSTNKKIDDAIKTFAKIFTTTTKVFSLVNGFDFYTLQSSLKDLQAHGHKQETELADWAKGQATPSSSVPQTTLSLTTGTTTVGGRENVTEEPLSRVEGKGIATNTDKDSSKNLVPASSIVRPDPDEPKAEEQERLLKITRPEVIKVVQEEAEKIGLDPKKITNAKAGEKFKKAQDAKHQVLKREYSHKDKRLTKLNKKRAEQYMWTMTNRIKPEPITDVKIHPNTKPDVLSVYRNNDKRNFDVHKPFKFADFGITELDELGPIIEKKKNSIVKDLMTSLSKRYERLKKIPKESYLVMALMVKMFHLLTTWLYVSFVNNMVIEELEYRIFFTDKFCDQSFQRWSDIDKVGMDLVSYLVMALMVKTEKNARFSLKLIKLIADHPDQDKLKSKKVKLEALGYQMY